MAGQAVLVVSFGTSHLDTLEKTIQPIEWDIAGRMTGRVQRRALTSGSWSAGTGCISTMCRRPSHAWRRRDSTMWCSSPHTS